MICPLAIHVPLVPPVTCAPSSCTPSFLEAQDLKLRGFIRRVQKEPYQRLGSAEEKPGCFTSVNNRSGGQTGNLRKVRRPIQFSWDQFILHNWSLKEFTELLSIEQYIYIHIYIYTYTYIYNRISAIFRGVRPWFPVRCPWRQSVELRFFHQAIDHSSDLHPDTLFWHSIIWKYIWLIYFDILSDFFWYSIWHIFWRSIWHLFWHSFWHVLGSMRAQTRHDSLRPTVTTTWQKTNTRRRKD